METKAKLKELELKLGRMQRLYKEKGIPLIISIDGLFGSGKGGVISRLGVALDARGFNIYSTLRERKEDKMYPFLYRFWNNIPANGRIKIFERSWNYALLEKIAEEKIDEKEKNKILREIVEFENTITASGVVLIKIYLDVSEKVQKERVKKMAAGTNTRWDVVKEERKESKNYQKYKSAMEEIIRESWSSNGRWKIVNSDDLDRCNVELFEYIIEEMEKNLEKKEEIEGIDYSYSGRDYIKESEEEAVIEREMYKKQLKKLQKELLKLEYKIYKKRVPVLIVYEGSDAAGKGGNIRRVVENLDPRGYEVVPVAAPTQEEKSYHYLWRFWRKFPKAGHMAIFDRSWYGRVLVERVEEFCSENEWKRAYHEINSMEKSFRDYGGIVIKIWLQIGKDEQLVRFKERENNPDKNWKITEEDWRNREKWELYTRAVNEMIEHTSVNGAEWKIINTNNKLAARLEALEHIVKRIKASL